jgi:hypothetical protein
MKFDVRIPGIAAVFVFGTGTLPADPEAYALFSPA